MNQLDFSPISEKEEESIDTFSFLQRETNTVYRRQLHHRSHGNMKPIFAHAATKMFLRLERATHNRKSYGFQLLKQFILFSSDEETIQVQYKYSRYELENAFKILDSTLGLDIKKTLVKTFAQLKLFAERKAVYSNSKNINKFAQASNKVFDKYDRLYTKMGFNLIKSFGDKRVQMDKRVQKSKTFNNETFRDQQGYKLKLNSLASESKVFTSASKQLRGTAEKQSTQGKKWKSNQTQTMSPLFSEKIGTIVHERDGQFETEQWRDDNQDSYKIQKAEYDNIEKFRVQSVKNFDQNFNESTQLKNATLSKKPLTRDGKYFTLATPIRKIEELDAFHTRRRKHSNNVQQQEAVQNVIVIRSAKKHKRSPDRYIRVPIISQQVKIIELIPESSGMKTQRLQTKTSRNSSSHERMKQVSNRSAHKFYEEEYLQAKIHTNRQYGITQRDLRNADRDVRVKENKTDRDLRNSDRSSKHSKYQKQQQYINKKTHQKTKIKKETEESGCDHCEQGLFCKYCQVIKDMEAFRMQRANMKITNYI